MPKSNWKGMISFGLVSIPIILYPTENKSADISFHQIDKRDNARIKYQRINANTGKNVAWEDIGRGYEYDKDSIIPVPDEMLKKVAGDNARSIDIENFIDKKELDLLSISNKYYLVPDKKGQKGYVILREALINTNKIGIAKVILSTKEYIAALLPYQQALILCLLKYDNEIRKMSEFDFPNKDINTYKVSKKEIDIAKKLILSMSTKWQPKKYIDEYQEAIHNWIEASIRNKPYKGMKKRPHANTNVVNLMDLLKKSLVNSGKLTKRPKSSKPLKKAVNKPFKTKLKHTTTTG